jgi:hypothetical protein
MSQKGSDCDPVPEESSGNSEESDLEFDIESKISEGVRKKSISIHYNDYDKVNFEGIKGQSFQLSRE